MKTAVQNAFLKFTASKEGALPFMYLDIEGYVTVGYGNLIDPVNMATALPFLNPDGTPMSVADITAMWTTVDALRSDPKGQVQTSGPATRYGQAFASYTTGRLTQEAMVNLFNSALSNAETTIRQYLTSWDSLCADAQMCVLSMAWAMGAGFLKTFTAFAAALNKTPPDYKTALANAKFKGNGVASRIAADALMLTNAAEAQAAGADPNNLYYPHAFDSGLATFLCSAGLTVISILLFLYQLHKANRS